MIGNLNRRTFLAGASAAVAAPTLAACSGGGNASNTPSSTTSGGKVSGEGVELTYMFRGGADERKAYDEAIKAFADTFQPSQTVGAE